MRRRVVITAEFEQRLDGIFGRERGPNGEPSAHDFLNVVIADLIEVLPDVWDDLPIDLRRGGVGPSVHVAVISASIFGLPYAVWGSRVASGVIELIDIEIHLSYGFSSDDKDADG